MKKNIVQHFPPGKSPGIPRWEAQVSEQESSKRQQCVRATELAERTGLKIRCAGLFDPIVRLAGRNSGKVFDESGRKTECMISATLLRCIHAAVWVSVTDGNEITKGEMNHAVYEN